MPKYPPENTFPNPSEGLPQLDFSDRFTRAAIGNITMANCIITPEDVAFVENSGLVDLVQAQAQDNFTIVHSTHPENAQKIAELGYSLGHFASLAPFSYSFTTVVPSAYPNAPEINKAALSYRYRGNENKLVFQFPFPFPAKALEGADRMPWGHTPLNKVEAYDSGLFTKNDTGEWFVSPKYLAGVINLDTHVSTLPKHVEKQSPLKEFIRKIVFKP